MEKSEIMKEFEDKTGLNATILTAYCGVMPRIYYSNWLESELLNAKEHVQNLEFLLNQKNENILQLEAKANISDETIGAFQEIIRNQCDEITALKAQLTWRPVSEKPEKDGWYLCKTQYADDTFGVETVFFNGKNFIYSRVIAWLPIPPTPEGEVK